MRLPRFCGDKQVLLSELEVLVMRNRPICFVLFSLMSAAFSVRAQDAVRSTTTDQEEAAESEPVVVSATRFDIPLDQSPASVSVIDSQDIDAKQLERVSDALRE